MRLEYQILAAMALDLFLGDPRWLPHPVRAIGRLTSGLEGPARRLVRRPRLAGALVTLLVVGASAALTWLMVATCAGLHPVAGWVVGGLLIYSTVALRDLIRHARTVHRALSDGNLEVARVRVGRIVGRDTEHLDEGEVTRAAVESVAESIVDGITAPLFWAVIGGPAGAMAYRAANTLDSTFGYMDEKHREFGWASARLDDVANYLPARLTAPVITLAAFLLRMRARSSWRILRRDARQHASPNAGFAESAVAGALGVQLGGLNYYFGKPSKKPTIGDPEEELAPHHITRTIALAVTASMLFLGFCLLMRAGLVWILNNGGVPS
jgi:adenosylcobinamide-phosphate synthase